MSNPQPVLPEKNGVYMCSKCLGEQFYSGDCQFCNEPTSLKDSPSTPVLPEWEIEFFERFGANKIWVEPSRENVETILEIWKFLRTNLTRLEAEKVKAVEARDKKLNKLVKKAGVMLSQYQLCEPTEKSDKWVEVVTTFRNLLDALTPEQKQGEVERVQQ